MASSFRSLFRWLVPSWLSTGDGERALHVTALLEDAFTERCQAGLESHFAERAGPSAIALIGEDRGIIRGRSETLAHYAKRLQAWRYPRGHRTRGSAYALLEQVSEYWGGVDAFSVDASDNRYWYSGTAGPSGRTSYALRWDNEPASKWARFWLFARQSDDITSHPSWGGADLFGGYWGNPNVTLGFAHMTPYDVATMRSLMRGCASWKPAGTRAEWLVIVKQGAAWPAAWLIDPQWSHWSRMVGTKQTSVRSAAFRYVSIDPDRSLPYVGDPTNYCTTFDNVAFSMSPLKGDPTKFPASITIPIGDTIVGDDASFPLSILLVDDGSTP